MNEQTNSGLSGPNDHVPASEPGKSPWPVKTIRLTPDSWRGVPEQTLVLPRTIPGECSYLILKIDSQDHHIPLTLRSDAPVYFQLAADLRSTFKAHLTFNFSPEQSQVYLRYSPDWAECHIGNLTAQTADSKTTITLFGQSTRKWTSKRWIVAPVLLLLVGLAYLFSSKPSDLVAALEKKSAEPDPVIPTTPVRILPRKPSLAQTKPSEPLPLPAPAPVKPDSLLVSEEKAKPQPVSPAVEPRQVSNEKKVKKETPGEKAQLSFQPVVPAKSANSDTGESDLERELNRKPRH
ncbi:hypothetical protein [Larkinella terrae]|uniref:Uncharacterized protein n=1 Tax=Larkinella terrae TaxID=2025311 RepID=A0A7K0ERS2_9BACT|nr:hypothetical protein [Larkinella terrae]MRS64459.1 hypothetical protein [Larkinella terrae]